jgi:hypothetical protein
MTPAEYDVFLSRRGAGDEDMVSEVAAGLSRLGFRVRVAAHEAGTDARPARLAAIEQAPDFVLISAPAVPGAVESGDDPRRAELAHAFKSRRNILVLADPAHVDSLAGEGLPGRQPFADWQRVTYDRSRTRESIALLSHRLHSSSEVEDRRFMGRVRAAAVTVAILLAVAVATRGVPAAVKWWNRPSAPPPLPRYVLYWAAYGQRLENGRWTSFPVTDGTSVAAGDQIRLAFSAGSDGHAYVMVRDTQGGVSALFPGATVRGASRVRAGTVCQVPGADRWITVDERTGIAAIYLIAGHDPLENLEELAEETDAGPSPAARMELLSSTIAGLLDGKHSAVPRPIRSRRGREIVDGLAPASPPSVWPLPPGDASPSDPKPNTQTGLLSAVVEIRIGAETFPRLRE